MQRSTQHRAHNVASFMTDSYPLEQSVKLQLPKNPESEVSRKEKLRVELRRQRKRFAHSPECEAATVLINAEIKALARNWDVFAAFVPYGYEPAILRSLEELYQQGKQILLPKLGHALQRRWAWYSGIDSLEEQGPKIPLAPAGRALEGNPLLQAEGIFIPALAIDTSGTRLGQGGGWYDRVLAEVENSTPLVGVIYANEFRTDPLPAQRHDRRVTAVITEAGFQQLEQ